MSRSVRTPTSRPSASVTKTESPVPVRWMACRQSAIDEPGATVTGCRRPTTLNGADTRPGTRAAVARSVSSVTRPVYARTRDRAVGGTGVDERAATSDTLADRGSDPRRRHHARRRQRHRVRLGRPVREARVRDRRRLADAHGLAVRDRRRDGLGRAGVQPVARDGRCDGSRGGRCSGRSASACSTSPIPPRTTRGSRPCRSGLSALIVYLYPPIVAVLALRLGRPLEGRRAWARSGSPSSAWCWPWGASPAGADIPRQGLLLILASPVFYSIWIILAARVSGERSDRVGHRRRRRGERSRRSARSCSARRRSCTGSCRSASATRSCRRRSRRRRGRASSAWRSSPGSSRSRRSTRARSGSGRRRRRWCRRSSRCGRSSRPAPSTANGSNPSSSSAARSSSGGVLLSQTAAGRRAPRHQAGDGADSTPVLPQPVVRLSED